MTERFELIADRLNARLAAISKAVPPVKPEILHYLDSDCGPSYCFHCAVRARGDEFDGFYPLNPSKWGRRTGWEEAFFDGIGATYDSESDVTEACYTCGKTLRYILTDYGVESEISYYLSQPLVDVRDEDSYALDRLTLNIGWDSSRAQLLGAAAIINQAWRIACTRQPGPIEEVVAQTA